jgi:pilus assembly protein CpaE
LVATNVAVSLAGKGPAVLLDLHPLLAYDDLLLDVPLPKSWFELLTVAHELSDRHLKLTVAEHESGLHILGVKDKELPRLDLKGLGALVQKLNERYAWLIIDLSQELTLMSEILIDSIDELVMISTGDLPALRNAQRMLSSLPDGARGKAGLVLNQIGRGHPADPLRIAATLDLPLLASLPLDSRAVGYQISFGTPCVMDNRSAFGREIGKLAQRLQEMSSRGMAELV